MIKILFSILMLSLAACSNNALKNPSQGELGSVREPVNLRLESAEIKGDALVVLCKKRATTVEVTEEPKEKKVHIRINNVTSTLPETAIKTFVVNMCGPANNFTYRIKGPSKVFRTDRNFVFNGRDGADNIDFRMQTNSHARPDVSLNARFNVDMNLQGGNDQIGIALNHIGENGRFKVNADLGKGYDGFTWKQDRVTVWAGDVDVKVDAGEGDDNVFIGLAQGLTVKQGAEAKFEIYGDEHPAQYDARDNEADHGVDTILAYVRGEIDGHFEMQFYGDDGIKRIRDLPCTTGAEGCSFREQLNRPHGCRNTLTFKNAPFSEQCIDLETALKASAQYQSELQSKYNVGVTHCRVPWVPLSEYKTREDWLLPECTEEQLRSMHPIDCRYPNEEDVMELPPCDPEFLRQLNYLRSYAQDTVQAKVDIRAGSEGTSYFKMNGELASDYTALIYENHNQPISRHRFELDGGQRQRYNHDMCWPDKIYNVPALNCHEFSIETVHPDLRH